MTTISFEQDLSGFQNIILLYRDENNNVFIGNTSFYGGSISERQYLSLLYKDALPKDRDVISGWNYLDDTSPNIYISYSSEMTTAVEDFMYSHGLEKNWRSIQYTLIDNYTDISKAIKSDPIKVGEVKAYAMRKMD